VQPRARAAVALAGLCALVLLAGCGGGHRLSKQAYGQKVQTVYIGIKQAFAGSNTKLGSLQELAARVHVVQKELRKAASELDDLTPPKDVQEQNETLVKAMRDYAADLDRLASAAERGDAQAVERFNQSIPGNEAVKEMSEAAEAMIMRGYDLGPFKPD
jgi:TolA-binding protein